MKPIIATPRQAAVLDALCELGQTDLVAYALRVKPRTVDEYVIRLMRQNKYPNRLTLVLAWDRERRSAGHRVIELGKIV